MLTLNSYYYYVIQTNIKQNFFKSFNEFELYDYALCSFTNTYLDYNVVCFVRITKKNLKSQDLQNTYEIKSNNYNTAQKFHLKIQRMSKKRSW